MGSSYNIWDEIKRGVPQGSILGPLLFNAFINDIFMFIEKTEICNFADDNTIYDCGEDLSNILENLKHYLKIYEHIDNLCRTANYKLHALRRIRKYLSLEKAKLLCNAFINSQFNYAPLVWMFCRKKQYLKIQKIHHKALKVVYNSNKNYDELLRNNNEVSIHQSHFRALICKVFKSLNNLNPEFMWSYFVFKNITYNIRKGPLLRLPAAKSTSYGINSVLFRACLLWKSLPQSIKYNESIVEFKKMKDLGNIDCSCILCR